MRTSNLGLDLAKPYRFLAAMILAGCLVIVGPSSSTIKKNVALLQLNYAMSEGNATLDTRVSRIELAKTLLWHLETLSEVSGVTDRLDLSQTKVVLDDFVRIGDHYLQLQNWLEAERWYDYAVLLYPTSGAAWYRLGYAYEKLNRSEEAARAYKESIGVGHLPDLEIGKSDPYCRLGALLREYESLRDLHQARVQLETGLQLDNFGSPLVESECYFELANTLRWQNSPVSDYIELYRRAVSANPENVFANIMLGVATYQLTGNIGESESYIWQSLSVLPTVRAYEELARMHEEEGEYEEAVALYEAALRLAVTNDAIPSIEEAISRLRAKQSADEIGIQP